MKKVLVLGSRGMLGHVLSDILSMDSSLQVVRASRDGVDADCSIDVSDEAALWTLIDTVQADIVVNCVGVLIATSKESPMTAIRVNALMPHVLSDFTNKIGSKLITVSTDCVFSGQKGAYEVGDLKDAGDPYGQSKSLGELDNQRDLTLRTSIIGPELKSNGVGLFDWFMKQEGQVSGYTEAFWSGVTTLELSRIIHRLILDFQPGLLQVAHDPKISKYDLLELIRRVFGKDLKVLPFDGKRVDKSLVHSTELAEVSSYETQILELYQYMSQNKTLYRKYFR